MNDAGERPFNGHRSSREGGVNSAPCPAGLGGAHSFAQAIQHARPLRRMSPIHRVACRSSTARACRASPIDSPARLPLRDDRWMATHRYSFVLCQHPNVIGAYSAVRGPTTATLVDTGSRSRSVECASFEVLRVRRSFRARRHAAWRRDPGRRRSYRAHRRPGRHRALRSVE